MADPVTRPGLGVPERAGAVHELCPVWAPYQVADGEEVHTTQQVPSEERSARVTLPVPSEVEPVATLTVFGPVEGPDTKVTEGSLADSVAASTDENPPAAADASWAACRPVESDCRVLGGPRCSGARRVGTGAEGRSEEQRREQGDRDHAQHGGDHREALVSGALGANGLPPALDHASTLLPAVRRPSPVPSEPTGRLVVAM
jgi:hypothetical protein